MRTLAAMLLVGIATPAVAETPPALPRSRTLGEVLYDPANEGKTFGEVIEAVEEQENRDLKVMLQTDTIRTDPLTWAAEGWGPLRWGMGYRDVIDATKATSLDPFESQAGRGLVLYSAKEIYDEPVRITASFVKDRLVVVILEPVTEDPGKRAAWMARVMNGLGLKYGNPRFVGAGEHREARWVTRRSVINASPNQQKVFYGDVEDMRASQRKEAMESL